MIRTTLTTLATSALLAGALAVPAQAATLAPLPRIPFGPGFVDLGRIGPGLPTLAGGADLAHDSAVVGGRLVFAGDTPARGKELWTTDGTPAGTHQVRDIFPGAGDAEPYGFTPYRGKVYFSAKTPGAGAELWVTDGTAAGTRMVVDLATGEGPSYPRQLTVVGDRLYFAAQRNDVGHEVWVYDPTQGVRLVTDLNPGSAHAAPVALTALGDGLLFSAVVDGFRHAFVTRGTEATTKRLDVEAPATDINADEFAVIGARAVFRAGNTASGSELWGTGNTEGSAAGIKDIWPGGPSSVPSGFTRLGDSAIFRAATPAGGTDLWTTDGTPGGTQMLRDIAGTEDAGILNLLRVGDTVYFEADDGVHGWELWQTKGSVSSTRMVRDLAPGSGNGSGYPLAGVGRRLVFGGSTPARGYEPWVLDPVTGTMRMITDLWPGAGDSDLYPIGVLGSTLIAAVTVDEDYRLVAYTATPSATRAQPRASYSRATANARRVRVPVRVTGDGRAVPGTVTLYRGSRKVGAARVVNGVANVRVTARLGRGRHVLRASYSGSVLAQSSRSAAFVVRVR